MSKLSSVDFNDQKSNDTQNTRNHKLALERKYEGRKKLKYRKVQEIKSQIQPKIDQPMKISHNNNDMRLHGNMSTLAPAKYKGYNQGNIATASYDGSKYTIKPK